MYKTILKKQREKAGLSQVEVAKQANITARGYQRIEAGEHLPNVRTAIKIAESIEIEKFADFKILWEKPLKNIREELLQSE